MAFHNRNQKLKTSAFNNNDNNYSNNKNNVGEKNPACKKKIVCFVFNSQYLTMVVLVAVLILFVFRAQVILPLDITIPAEMNLQTPMTVTTVATHPTGRRMVPREISPSLMVRGNAARYSPIPDYARRTFYATGKGASIITKVMEEFNWTRTTDQERAHLYMTFQYNGQGKMFGLVPFQRFGRVPNFADAWKSKDTFQDGFRLYARSLGLKEMWFIPLTYRISEDVADRQEFLDRLSNGDGMEHPWVLKQVNLNNGKGIEMLPPRSKALKTAVQRIKDSKDTYIVQQYICNELTWFRGQKFDLRMYWLVASVDPLIVLYADGYVRAGKAPYNETNWSTTGDHLTNHNFRGDDDDVTHEHLWTRIREHHDRHRAMFQARGIYDPKVHVQSQMKEALARAVAAFQRGILQKARRDVNIENFFSFYGCDFILDADLDVWLIELQSSPGLGEGKAFRLEMWKRLFPPMVEIVEEIAMKQASDPQGNILPLMTTRGVWELIYADGEIFQYDGYIRSTTKKACLSAAATT